MGPLALGTPTWQLIFSSLQIIRLNAKLRDVAGCYLVVKAEAMFKRLDEEQIQVCLVTRLVYSFAFT